jgi:hypothetical protein
MLFLCFSYISHGFSLSFAKLKNVSFWTLLYFIPHRKIQYDRNTLEIYRRENYKQCVHFTFLDALQFPVSLYHGRIPDNRFSLSPMLPSAQMSARIVTLLSQDVVYCRSNTHSCIDFLFHFS